MQACLDPYSKGRISATLCLLVMPRLTATCQISSLVEPMWLGASSTRPRLEMSAWTIYSCVLWTRIWRGQIAGMTMCQTKTTPAVGMNCFIHDPGDQVHVYTCLFACDLMLPRLASQLSSSTIESSFMGGVTAEPSVHFPKTKQFVFTQTLSQAVSVSFINYSKNHGRKPFLTQCCA